MKRRTINWTDCLLILLVLLVALIAILPLVSVFINSLADPRAGNLIGGGAAKIIFKPYPITYRQYYIALLENRETTMYFANTLRIVAPILLFGTLFAIPSGYAFAKFDFPFKKVLFFVYVLVMLLPVQINVVGTYIFFRNIDLVERYAGVILPGIFSSFGAFLIYQFMKSIPDETMESARLDGADEAKILFQIVIPQVKAGIASMLVLILIDSWNMVEMPMAILRDEWLYPMSIMLRYMAMTEPRIVFACVIIFSIPLLLIFLIAQDNLTEGIARSAVIK